MAKNSDGRKEKTTPSDQEIAIAVENLLRQSWWDPQKAAAASSVHGVIHQLGADFGVDLSLKAAFIRDHINFLRHSPPPPPPPYFGSGHPAEVPRFHQNFHQFMSAHTHWMQQLQSQYPSQFAPPAYVYPGYAPPYHIQAPPPQQPRPPVKKESASNKGQKESSQSGAEREKGDGTVKKLYLVSPELQAIVGKAAMTRIEIVKRVLDYASENNIYDPSDKQMIVCDEALRAIFGTDCIDTNMIPDNENLARHVLPLNPPKDSVSSKRQKMDIEDAAEPPEEASAVTISNALALFLGTTRREMLPSEASQRVLEYVKVKILEDPSSMVVVCDAKLRELFGCDTVPVLRIKDLLARHHLFQSS